LKGKEVKGVKDTYLLKALTALNSLERAGFVFTTDGHALRWRGPSGALTSADRESLRLYKPGILEVLTARRTFDAGGAYDPGQATAAARREFRRGEITSAQRDFRLGYADGEVSHD
jgi:hypothetical protein